MSDLSLVPTDDLVKELLSRVDCGVIILTRNQSDRENGSVMAIRRWKGCDITCIGLATIMTRVISRDMDKRYVSENECDMDF